MLCLPMMLLFLSYHCKCAGATEMSLLLKPTIFWFSHPLSITLDCAFEWISQSTPKLRIKLRHFDCFRKVSKISKMRSKYSIDLLFGKHWNFGNCNEWKIDKNEEFVTTQIAKILNELISFSYVIFLHLKNQPLLSKSFRLV